MFILEYRQQTKSINQVILIVIYKPQTMQNWIFVLLKCSFWKWKISCIYLLQGNIIVTMVQSDFRNELLKTCWSLTQWLIRFNVHIFFSLVLISPFREVMFGTGIPKLFIYIQQTVMQRRDNNLILTISISYTNLMLKDTGDGSH